MAYSISSGYWIYSRGNIRRDILTPEQIKEKIALARKDGDINMWGNVYDHYNFRDDKIDMLNFSGSVFINCNFEEMNLWGTQFNDSILIGCNFNSARMCLSEFKNTSIRFSTFHNASMYHVTSKLIDSDEYICKFFKAWEELTELQHDMMKPYAMYDVANNREFYKRENILRGMTMKAPYQEKEPEPKPDSYYEDPNE